MNRRDAILTSVAALAGTSTVAVISGGAVMANVETYHPPDCSGEDREAPTEPACYRINPHDTWVYNLGLVAAANFHLGNGIWPCEAPNIQQTIEDTAASVKAHLLEAGVLPGASHAGVCCADLRIP